MKTPEKGAFERSRGGCLPGTRPLTPEEYECLATTHPYVVKQLVASKAVLPRQWNDTKLSFGRGPAEPASVRRPRESRPTEDSGEPLKFQCEPEEEVTHHQRVTKEKHSSARVSGIAPVVRHTWQDGARLHLSAKVSLALTDSGTGFCKGSGSSRRRNSVDLHSTARKDSSPEGDLCMGHSAFPLPYSEPSRNRVRRASVGKGTTWCKCAEDGDGHKDSMSFKCSCSARNRQGSLASKERYSGYRGASASPRLRGHDEAYPAHSSGKWVSRETRSLKRCESLQKSLRGGTFEGEKPTLHETQRFACSARGVLTRSGDALGDLTAELPKSACMKDESHRQLLLGSLKSGGNTERGRQQDPFEEEQDLGSLVHYRSSRRRGSADAMTKEDCDCRNTYFARSRAAPMRTTRRSGRRESQIGGNDTSKAPSRRPSTDMHERHTLSKTTQTHSFFPSRLEKTHSVAQEEHKLFETQRAASRTTDAQHKRRTSRGDHMASPSRWLDSAGARGDKTSRLLSGAVSNEISTSADASGVVQDERRRQGAQGHENRSRRGSMSGRHGEREDLGAVQRGGSASARLSEQSSEFSAALSSKFSRGDETRTYEGSGSARQERRHGSASQRGEREEREGHYRDVGEEPSLHLRHVFASQSNTSAISGGTVREALSSSVRGPSGGSRSSIGETGRHGKNVDRLSYAERIKSSRRSENHLEEEDVLLSHVSGRGSSIRSRVRSDDQILGKSSSEQPGGASRRQGSATWKAGDEVRRRRVSNEEEAFESRLLDSAVVRGSGEVFRSSSGSTSKQWSSAAGEGRTLEDEEGRHDAEGYGSRKIRRGSISGQHDEPEDVGGVQRVGSASARLGERSGEFSAALSSKLSRGDEIRSYKGSGSVGLDRSRSGSQHRPGSASQRAEGQVNEVHPGNFAEESSMHVRDVFAPQSASSVSGFRSVIDSGSSSARRWTGGGASSVRGAGSQGVGVNRLSCGEGSKFSRSEKHLGEEDMLLSQLGGSGSSSRARVRADAQVFNKYDSEPPGGASRRQGSASRTAAEEVRAGGVRQAFESRLLDDSSVVRGSGEFLRSSSGSSSKQSSSSAAKGRMLKDEEGGQDAEGDGSRRIRRESISGQHGERKEVQRVGSASAMLGERASGFSAALSGKSSGGDESRSYEGSGSVGLERFRSGSQHRRGSASQSSEAEADEILHGNAAEGSSMHLRDVFGSRISSSGRAFRSSRDSLSSSVRGLGGRSKSSMGEAGRPGVGSDRLSCGEGSNDSKGGEKHLKEENVLLSHISGSRSSTRTSVRSDGQVFGKSSSERGGASRRQGTATRKAAKEVRTRRMGDEESASESRLLDSARVRGSGEFPRSSSGSTSTCKQSSLSAGEGRMLKEEARPDPEGYESRRTRRESMSGQHGEPEDVSGVQRGGSASARLGERSSGLSVALSSNLSRGDEMKSYGSSGSAQLESFRSGSRSRQGSVSQGAEGEAKERPHGLAEDESSMPLRDVFAFKSYGSATSRRSVTETLSSRGRGLTGGIGSSIGEAQRQGLDVDKSIYHEASKWSEKSEKHLKEEDVRLSQVSGSESLTGSKSSTRTSARSDDKVIEQTADFDSDKAEGVGIREESASRKAEEELEKGSAGDRGKASVSDLSGSAGMQGRGESLKLSSNSTGRQSVSAAGKDKGIEEVEGGRDAERYESRRSRRDSLSGEHGKTEGAGGGGASARVSERLGESSMARTSIWSRGDEMRYYQSSGSTRLDGSGRSRGDGRERLHGNLGEDSSMHLRDQLASESNSSASGFGSACVTPTLSGRGTTGGARSSMEEARRQGVDIDESSYRGGSKRSERSEKHVKEEDVRLSQLSGSESLIGSKASTRTSAKSTGKVLEQAVESNKDKAESAGIRQGSARSKAGEEIANEGVGAGEKASVSGLSGSGGMRGRGESVRSSSNSTARESVLSTGRGRGLEADGGGRDAEGCESRRSRGGSVSRQPDERDNLAGVHRGGSASLRLSELSSEFTLASASNVSRGDDMRAHESSGSRSLEGSKSGSRRPQGSTSRREEGEGRERHHENVRDESSMLLRNLFASQGSTSASGPRIVRETLRSSAKGSTGGSGSSMKEAGCQGVDGDRLSCREGGTLSERSDKRLNEEAVRLSHVSGSESLTGSRSSTSASGRSEGGFRRQGSASKKVGEELGKGGEGYGKETSGAHFLNSAGVRRSGGSLKSSSGFTSSQSSLSTGKGRMHMEEGEQASEEYGSRRSRRESMSGQHTEPDNFGGAGASAKSSESSGDFSAAVTSKLPRGDDARSCESSGSVRLEGSGGGSRHRQGSTSKRGNDEEREGQHVNVGEESSMHLNNVFAPHIGSSRSGLRPVRQSLSSSGGGGTGGSSIGEAEHQGVDSHRLSYGEGSKRSGRGERHLKEEDVRLSHSSGNESSAGRASSTRVSVRSAGQGLGQCEGEEAEGAGRREGSTIGKAGNDARGSGVGLGEDVAQASFLTATRARGSEEAFELSSLPTTKQSSLLAGKGRALEDEEGGQDAERLESRRSRRESLSGQHAEPDDFGGVQRGGSVSAKLRELSSGLSVALSSKLSKSDGIRSSESSGSVGRKGSRSGSRRPQRSISQRAEGEERDGHYGDVGEESSLRLRNVFASQKSSSASEIRSVRDSLSSTVRGLTGGSGSSMGRSERQEADLHRSSYDEASKRSGRGDEHSKEQDVRLSHVSGKESLARTSVRSDAQISGQSNREEAECVSHRQGSASWKAGGEARKAGVGDGETVSDSRLSRSAGMRGGGESVKLSSGSTGRESVLSAGKGGRLQNGDGGQDAEGHGSGRTRHESVSEQQAKAEEVGEGSAPVRVSEGSREFSVAQSTKISRGDGMRPHESSGLVRRETCRSGSQRRQGSAEEEGREPHDGSVGQRSSMHLRDVFASQKNSSVMSKGSVRETLSSSGRGLTGSTGTSTREAAPQAVDLNSFSFGKGSKSDERSGNQLKEDGVRLSHVGASASLSGSGVSTRTSSSSDAKSRRLFTSGGDVCDSVDLQGTGNGRSAHFENVSSKLSLSETGSNTPTASQEKVDSSMLRGSGSRCGTQAQLAKSLGEAAGGLPPYSTSMGEELQSCKEASGRALNSRLFTSSRVRGTAATPVFSSGLRTPRLGIDEGSMLQEKATMGNLPSRTPQEACESGNMLWEKTLMKFSESSALDNFAHASCNSPEMLASVLNSAVTSGNATCSKAGIKSANKPAETSASRGSSGPAERGSWELTREPTHGMTGSQCNFIEQGQFSSRDAGASSYNARGTITNAWASTADESACGDGRLQRSTADDEGLGESLSTEGPAACPKAELQTAQQDGSKSERSPLARRKELQQASNRGSTHGDSKKTSLDSPTPTATSSKKSSSSFCTAVSTESSFASAETLTPEAYRSQTSGRKSSLASVGDKSSTKTADADASIASSTQSSLSSRRRRNSAGDVESAKLKADIGWRHVDAGRPRKSTLPGATYSRPSYIDGTAMGRRLTAQNNMWSRVGNYEPLSSAVFHGVFPSLSSELQNLCMQCVGTPDSPELRSLTDIQKAAMALVAKQSVQKSAAAKSRIAREFKKRGLPQEALEQMEQFLLSSVPILIYFDIASLTPHLVQGGYYRSHFEIPQTDATYLRKCNEREQAFYSGLYEHESVRPEHHPKYGYVSLNCVLQPPWEPQSGEACLILKDHVRVRTTISASPQGAESELYLNHEPLVATLNNPWHVLEALGYDALIALAACARDPSASLPPEISGLIDCNIHGDLKLGRDVEAIAVPKCSARDKAMVSKLQSIATRYMVPLISMEHFPRAIKNDSWRHVVRHLQHEVLLKKTSLGNTYGQI